MDDLATGTARPLVFATHRSKLHADKGGAIQWRLTYSRHVFEGYLGTVGFIHDFRQR